MLFLQILLLFLMILAAYIRRVIAIISLINLIDLKILIDKFSAILRSYHMLECLLFLRNGFNIICEVISVVINVIQPLNLIQNRIRVLNLVLVLQIVGHYLRLILIVLHKTRSRTLYVTLVIVLLLWRSLF